MEAAKEEKEERKIGRERRREKLLRNRRGFIRLALQCGASLVPTFSFGEKRLYNLVRASCLLPPASFSLTCRPLTPLAPY